MIISVKWLQDYVDIDMPIDELATLIGARLVEIEEVIDYGAKYKDVIVAKVISCVPLEGSDHLSVVKLDDGAKANVERDENGYVQVVCGAPNIREGLFVAWLPPKSIVPETYGTEEPFALDARKLRGVMSNGMIASAKELALYDEHDGIFEIDLPVDPGESLIQLLHLDDTLLDIENKSLTHRPDTFGVIGFAREVAGIQGKQFTTPKWLTQAETFAPEVDASMPTPKVTIDNPELSSRYQGLVIQGVDGTAKAAQTLQTYLARVGMRPINAIVDVTNYLMLETGQPLHAFDYDKLAAVNNGQIDIHVRAGRENETLELLDGRTINLSNEDIVIANGETAVALAGAMGGAATEVDENTKTIFLESATFNLYNLRATQMRHGIFSEAITRFTKGQPAELTEPVLIMAAKSLGGFMDSRIASEIVEAYPGKHDQITVELSAEKINSVLGSKLSSEEIARTLRNVEFDVELGDLLRVTVPYWRNDIHIPEDVIEEVGRLNGFDAIDPTLPGRDFTATRPSRFDETRSKIRDTLTRAGANEVLTYSFVHGDILNEAMQQTENSYRITNSISPSLQYYRQSLTPSLLGLIHPNVKQGYDTFAIYELNKVHPKAHGLTDEGVPNEVDMLAFVVASKRGAQGAMYYQARKVLDYLADMLGLDLIYTPVESDSNYPVTAPFEPKRSALVTDGKTDTSLGIIGEYKKSVTRAFKLPDASAGFEVSSAALDEAIAKLSSDYMPISRYPGTERDICFQVEENIQYSDIIAGIEAVLSELQLETKIEPVDIYRPNSASTKNVTVRIKLTSHEKTLTSEEGNKIVDDIVSSVSRQTGATVV